jgi:hypothetical protein
MGNGLFNPPPPTNGTVPLPDIPVPSFVSIGQDATAGAKKSGWIEHFWNVFWHAMFDGFVWVLTQIGSFAQAFASIPVDVFTKLQAVNSPGFFALLASLIEDLLAVEVDGQALQDAFRAGGTKGALRATGASFYDNLTRIFQAGGTALPWTATDVPAKQFMGFLIEYAVRSANAECLTQLLPEEFRVGEGFKAYGEKLERTLSLGRMARIAFQPLVRTMVSDPLTRQLNAAYTPKLLNESQYVHAFIRGDMDAGTLQKNLAELGYHPDLQNLLIAESTKSAGLHELLNFSRATDPTATAPVAALQTLGYSPTNAQVVWTAALESLVDPLRKTFLNELTNELRKGEIDISTALGILGTLNLFPQEAEWYRQIWSQMIAAPRRLLTEAQLETAFLEGVIDMSTVQANWQQRGYSLESIQTLSLLLIAKQQGHTKTTVGHKPIKHLTEAELEKAYKAGILTLAQLQAQWALLGYSAADIQTLTALVQLPPSSTGSTPA